MMDLFKYLFGIFRRDEPPIEVNDDDLRRNFLEEPDSEAGSNERNRNENDIPSELIDKFFHGNNSENNQVSRFGSGGSGLFHSHFFMNPFELEKQFDKMMEEMTMQFQGTMGSHWDFFENEGNYPDNHNHTYGLNEPPDESEMLRRKYLIDPDDVGLDPSKKEDISLEGKISPEEIVNLVKSRNEQSNQLAPQITIRSSMSSIFLKIGPDGVAEITKVEKSNDGKEERTVTRWQLKK